MTAVNVETSMCIWEDSPQQSMLADAVSKEISFKCLVVFFLDCPIDRCSLNCSTTCMCNTTVTGDNKISSICPYGCSYNTTSPYQQCDNGKSCYI